MKKKKKIFKYSVSVAVLAAMMQTTTAFASPVTQGQIDTTKGQINATQGQIDDFETKMQQLDNQISVGMYKSQQLDDEIKIQQDKIKDTENKVVTAKEDLDTHKKVYSARLQSMQTQGQQPLIAYADILFSSKNLSDFLTRSTAITQILQSDSDLMNTLNEKEQILKDMEQQLHNQIDGLKKNQNELTTEQQKIEADKQEVETQLANSKNALEQQQSQLNQQQSQLAQQQAQQRALELAQEKAAQQSASANNTQAVPANNIGSPSYSGDKASRVIAYAEQFLGIPYVWGGSTPSGFDCSGLMQYSFRNALGINLPRVSEAQQNVGTRISPYSVQPGDLVFMGNPAYHVGMYIGGGKWIEAPETGDVVKIANYNPSRFSSAARVL